jgi:hypothetical protein
VVALFPKIDLRKVERRGASTENYTLRFFEKGQSNILLLFKN